MNREFDERDMQENRMIAAFGYIVFFVPLLMRPHSKLARYCANQGLLLLIVIVLLRLFVGIFTIIPLLGWIFKILGRLITFAGFLLGLFCTLQLTTYSRVIELPYIGAFRLIQ